MKKALVSLVAAILILTVAVGTASAASIKIGDFTGDDKINTGDAVYLLYSVVYGRTQYPLNQSGDMNSNGVVDEDDALHLLYHTHFGAEKYPLPFDKDEGFGEWRPLP